MLTQILMNSVRKNKGIAIMALAYYLLSLGKKKLRENAAPENMSSPKRNSRSRR